MRPRTSRWFVLVLAGLLGICQRLPAQQDTTKDWPSFRGNSLQTGVTDSPLPETLAVRWSFKSQDGIRSSPVIVAKTVYVGALDGKLYAFDLLSGKQKWQYQAVAFQATPAVRDGAVYVGDARGTFHCVDAATGKQRWTVAIKGAIASPANFAEDKIVFGSDDHHLYCLSTDGKLVWQYKTKEKLQGAPAVAGDRVIVAGCDHTLRVVDLAKGQELTAVPMGGHVGASIAVRGDHAYVGNMANQFLAVDWKKGVIHWQFQAKRNGQAFFSSPAVTDELVVVGSRDKQVRALQRQTGKEVWTFATKGRVDSSPVIAGQRVLVGSLDGHLYVLDLARGTELSRFDLGGPITGAPAVGGESVVVATFSGGLYCLAAKK